MSNPLGDLPRLVSGISPAWRARLRAGATLGVLLLLVAVAVRVGLDRVSEPFPQVEEPPLCTPTDLQAGDRVQPEQVTVSVLNAGGPSGLASRTLSDLVDEGFGRGQLDNAPEDSPRVRRSQIWSPEGSTAAVRLVQSHLQGRTRVVERQGPAAGITVVVGENFETVKDGRGAVRVTAEAETTCVPTAPAETVTVPPGA
jgi:hypothetical protein